MVSSWGMMGMAREPLYRKTEEEMLRRIRSGDWEIGRRLPNEFSLADEFGVSQGTMRRALITLEGMGLLTRKPGRGTIVAKATPAPDKTAGLLLTDLAGAPLQLTVMRATSSTAQANLGPSPAMRVAKLERILKRGSARFALEETLVSAELCPKLKETASPDFEALLTEHDIGFDQITATASAAVTTMGQSVALACDRYTALICLTRTAYDAQGQAIAQQNLCIISEELRLSAS